MKIERCKKESFIIVRKEGATIDGAGSTQKLWDEADSHLGEIQDLVQEDEDGDISGIWGAMYDLPRSFQLWEDFGKGLYLAGMEYSDDVEAPDGWTKWVILGYEHIYVECENDGIFSEVIRYLVDNDTTLVEAVHELTCPQTGKGHMFFPIKKP